MKSLKIILPYVVDRMGVRPGKTMFLVGVIAAKNLIGRGGWNKNFLV